MNLTNSEKKWMEEYLLPTANCNEHYNRLYPTLECSSCQKTIDVGDSLSYETTGYTPYCEDRECTEGVAVYHTVLEPCWWSDDKEFWDYWDKLINKTIRKERKESSQ